MKEVWDYIYESKKVFNVLFLALTGIFYSRENLSIKMVDILNECLKNFITKWYNVTIDNLL